MKTGLKVVDAMTKNLVTVIPDSSVRDCAELMENEGLGSLIVMGKKLEGIVTEQDLVYKVIAKGKDPQKTKVSSVMTTHLVTISPNEDIHEAMKIMARSNVRRLPVVDGKEVMGVLTMKDVLKIEPALFEIAVEKIELREEAMKPISLENEGICQSCGNYSEKLMEVEGIMVCTDCSEEFL